MKNGIITQQDLLKALLRLGAKVRYQGGETLAIFGGTTITLGRRPFSRAMLRRVERKLADAGIAIDQLYTAIRS